MNTSCIIKQIGLKKRTFIMRGRTFDSINLNKGIEFYF